MKIKIRDEKGNAEILVDKSLPGFLFSLFLTSDKTITIDKKQKIIFIKRKGTKKIRFADIKEVRYFPGDNDNPNKIDLVTTSGDNENIITGDFYGKAEEIVKRIAKEIGVQYHKLNNQIHIRFD